MWNCFRNFLKVFVIIGTKTIKLPKTPKNCGLPQDFFRRAKRAGKIFHLGFSEKTLAEMRVGPAVAAHARSCGDLYSEPAGIQEVPG